MMEFGVIGFEAFSAVLAKIATVSEAQESGDLAAKASSLAAGPTCSVHGRKVRCSFRVTGLLVG